MKKIKPLDPLVNSTREAFAHRDSLVVVRQRELLEFEARGVAEGIENLKSDAKKEEARLAALRARISGLTLVIERR